MEQLVSTHWQDYALLDSGNGRKLERFGPYVLSRPEARATWTPALPSADWNNAHAEFREKGKEKGHWQIRRSMEPSWEITYRALRFRLQIDRSRQIGVFPENATHWDWIARRIANAEQQTHVLNLFGYTGLATLVAARAGARVTHVDASKRAVNWARENQRLSGLQDRSVRWIVDDALKYVGREARRGVHYDGIVLDPPAFGRGPGGEVWRFEKLFPELCEACRSVLGLAPKFVVATVYTRGMKIEQITDAVAAMVAGFGGQLNAGTLITREQSGGRNLANALFVRWWV
ncbi:MAG: class I SAM-dependent methyltransferase [Chloroflexota bacterium]|nr:class I SAM-dependent methyltransferase [Chloroflexota bacterium]